MANFAEWNFTDFLGATPYGKKRRKSEKGQKISEEEFYKEGFFIEPVSWEKKCKEIVSFFKDAGTENINTILLYGYQGTGKTTFLHWALGKRNYFDNYGKIILDMEKVLVGLPNNSTNPSIIFDVFFRQELNIFYSEKPVVVVDILKLLLSHLNLLHSSTFTTQYDKDKTFWDKLTTLNKELITPNSETPCVEDKLLIANFFRKLCYTDTFLLFLLLYFKLDDINYKEKYGFQKPPKNIRKLLIVFDNIDGVRMEQTNAAFPATIAYLYEQFCLIIDAFGWEEIPIMNFIFSVRDYNYSLLELQSMDQRQTKEIDFEPPENLAAIMEKRAEIASKYNSQHSSAYNFLKVFFHDLKFHEIFLPLFNFNMRKLATNFSSILEILSIDNVNKFLEWKKILKDCSISNIEWSYTNGLRGIFYAVIIKALLEYDNLRPALLYEAGEKIELSDEKGEKCTTTINPARILLTIIHSLTKYNDLESNTKSQPVGLGDVYKDFKRIFIGETFIDVFFDKLTALFRLYEKNWCHLISFRNKQIFDTTVFDEEKRSLKMDAENDDLSFLNEIEVKINRSAHIYLTRVVTHYEFYSMRAGNAESLFLSVEKKDLLKNIDRVWKIVGPCLSSLIKYLEKTTVEHFEDTNLCLKVDNREGSEKTAMAFRIIHMQLRYIDDFRKFVYFLSIKKEINIDFKKLNKLIIFRQRRYIKKLEDLCKARRNRYDNMASELSNNLKRQKEMRYDKYFSLLNDKRDHPSDNP